MNGPGPYTEPREFPWVWDEELETYRLIEGVDVWWTEGIGPLPVEGRFFCPPEVESV